MAGIVNNTVFGKNVDFSGAVSPAPTILTNGQMLIGATTLNAGGTHINVGTITSTGGTITVTYASPNINLETVPASGTVSGLIPDTTSGAGTSPVRPNGSGNITITDTAIAATGGFTNGIQTISTAANSLSMQLQYAGANASATAGNYGIAQFNSSDFTVVNGFVSSVAAPPSSGFTTINTQIIISTAVYTPSANLAYAYCELIGGGGGGGGASAVSAGQVSVGGGGGGGGYSAVYFTAAFVNGNSPLTCNIGAGGAGGAAGPNAGSPGGVTTITYVSGSTPVTAITAYGGQGGGTVLATGTSNCAAGGTGGATEFIAGGGNGGYGQLGYALVADNIAIGGAGGTSGKNPFTGQYQYANSAGSTFTGSGFYGVGGGGATSIISSPFTGVARAGGNGASGYILITEYIT